MKTARRAISNFFRRLSGVAGARLLAGLILAIFALFFFAWLAEEVFEGATANFDEQIRAFVHQFASPPLTGLMETASFLGSTLFLMALGVIMTIIFIFAKRRRAIALFGITMAGAIVLNFALKNAFHRPRPQPFFNVTLPTSYSFPSGHALFSVCFYGGLAWILTRWCQNRILSTAIWVTTIFLIFLIGLSRIYLGVHYPSDVVAGYAAAFVWVFAVVFSDYFLRHRNGRE